MVVFSVCVLMINVNESLHNEGCGPTAWKGSAAAICSIRNTYTLIHLVHLLRGNLEKYSKR